MADAYVKLAKSVDKLLAFYGKDATIIKIVPGGYNPATGSVDPDTEVSYTARAVESGYTLENLADTLIEAGARAGVMKITDASFTGDLSTSMKIEIAGDHQRNLREVQPVTPGPACLYWRFVTGT